MKKEQTPLWIQKLNWEHQYYLDEVTPDKTLNIDSYLIHNVSPYTNNFKYTVTNLARKFHCSRNTIYHALKVLNNIDGITAKNNYVHFNNYIPLNDNKKEGKYND